ncbi:MAG: hypothetical protein IJT73_04955 [Selenomonadaceae bacterium]|nr:hypothetical protein [Selenomonadaceae bacterium]
MDNEKFLQRLSFCFTLQEIIQSFTLPEIMEAARAGLIQDWIRENVSDDAANFLSQDKISEWNNDELCLAVCQIFSVDLNSLTEYEAQSVSRAIKRKQLKEIYIEDGEEGAIVTNQRELLESLNAGYIVIYLVGGIFQIPLLKGGVTYIGRENALVEVSNFEDVSFDRAEIILKDLQLFVRQPINIECQNSTNVKILRGEKIALDNSIKKNEIYRLLQGRNAFETFEEFDERAKKMNGIVVGEVALEEKNYNIKWQVFDLKILWRLDFLNVARKFLTGKFFSCVVTADFAKKIYENERVQLVYADFVTDGNFPIIRCLYMITADGIRIDIKVGNIPLIDEIAGMQNYGSGSVSGSCGRGYGLELIENFKNKLNPEVTFPIIP